MTNIFVQIHTDREGNETPIVSMDANHLCNLINVLLNKQIAKIERKAREEFAARFAPTDMTDAQRTTFGLRKATPRDLEKLEQAIEDLKAQQLERMLDKAMPYIVVGIARNDTRDGVVRILQEATGITERIIIQSMMRTNNEVEEEDEDPELLTPGDFEFTPGDFEF